MIYRTVGTVSWNGRYIYTCVYVYIYIYVCTYIYLYVHIYKCVYIYICVLSHFRTYFRRKGRQDSLLTGNSFLCRIRPYLRVYLVSCLRALLWPDRGAFSLLPWSKVVCWRRRIRGTSEILECMQKVRRTRVWRKTGKKMLPRMCVLCVCVCVPSHFRSYFRCKEKLPCVCVCVCVCKGNPPPFNVKKWSNSGPRQLMDGCSACCKFLLFQGDAMKDSLFSVTFGS